MPARDKQIGPTVVVDVRHRRAVGVEPLAAQPGLLGHVLELEIAQVLVELAGWPLISSCPCVVVAAAAEKDVEQAVAVEVDQRSAAAQRFENGIVDDLAVFVLVAVFVGVVDAESLVTSSNNGGPVSSSSVAFVSRDVPVGVPHWQPR